jgi:RHS repeat-associated protein
MNTNRNNCRQDRSGHTFDHPRLLAASAGKTFSVVKDRLGRLLCGPCDLRVKKSVWFGLMAFSLPTSLSLAAVSTSVQISTGAYAGSGSVSGDYTAIPIPHANPPEFRIKWNASIKYSTYPVINWDPQYTIDVNDTSRVVNLCNYYWQIPPGVAYFSPKTQDANSFVVTGYYGSSFNITEAALVINSTPPLNNYYNNQTRSYSVNIPIKNDPVAFSVDVRTTSYTFSDPAITDSGQLPNPGAGSGNIQPGGLVAEPVNVTTGAFYEDHIDLHVNGPLPIEVRRSYSSLNIAAMNEFGFGWLSGYPSYLIPSFDFSTIQAADTDGTVVVFRLQQGSTTVWSPLAADNPNLTNTSGGASNLFNSTIVQSLAANGVDITYQWNLPDGSVRNYLVESFPVTTNGVSVIRKRPYLTSYVDNRHNTLTFNYGTNSNFNDWGRINLVQSSNGGSVSFTYDTEGHILTATATSDPSGNQRTVNYTYSPSGDLTAVQLSDGNTFNYQYGAYPEGDSNHLIAQATNPDGNILQNTYDGAGRVLTQLATVDQASPNTPVTTATFDYSVPGQTTVTDAYGHPTVYQYNAGGLITQITDPLGQTIIQAWYAPADLSPGAYPNSLQSVTDKRGLVMTYQYDALGNTTETDVTGHLIGDSTTETATTSARYNNLNLPLMVTDASGIVATYTYGDGNPNHAYLPTQIATSKGGSPIRTDLLAYIDQSGTTNGVAGFSNGLLATKTVASGSSDQAVTTYIYNSDGFLAQQTVQTGTADPNVVSTFVYNLRDELVSVTDADNRSTTYTYDGMSRPLTKTVKDENGNVLGAWTMTYTGTGQLSQTTGPRTSPANSVQRTYDGGDRLEEEVMTLSQAKSDGTGVTVANDAVNDYVYDYSGNLVLEMDPLGNETTMTYDANGQMLTKKTAGLRNESFTYEPGGKVATYTNPLGGVTSTFYTSTGQLSEQDNPDGSVLKWRYQTDGRLSQEILRNGSTWTTTYDDVNRTVTRRFTDGTTESSTYDRRGNLISHTDPDGFTKTATYDGLNRVKTTTGPATAAGSAQQTTTYIYGASPKIVTVQNALGEKTVTTSDALDRPVLTQVFDSSGNAVRTTSYTYSVDHNSVTVTEGTGAGAISRTTWTNTLEQPVLTVLGDGTFTSNAYDVDGNLLSMTDALHQTTSYAYNDLNQLVLQTLPDGTATNFNYDAAGNQLTRAMADGTLTQQQVFDPAGRKTSEELFSGSTVTRQYSYAYYPAGSPDAGLLETVTAPRDTITTTYDDFLRPSTVTTLDSGLSTPNPALNSTTTYTYDLRNLVTGIAQSETVNGEPTTVNLSRTYDGYGQLLTETVSAGGATYANVAQTWDAAGRRATLNDASSSLPPPLFAYTHRADGLLTHTLSPALSLSNGSQLSTLDYSFSYADNGLLTSRVNPFRSMTVDTRDPVGRILQQTQVVGSTAPLVENMTWRNNSTLASYTATRTGTGAWNESRAYTYDPRGQLLSEGFSAAPNASNALNYAFDGNNPGLGVRLDAKIGTGAPVSWETNATPNSLGQVITDNQMATSGQIVPASGDVTFTWTVGQVNILVDGISQGAATISGNTWSANLDLSAGTHNLTANAVDPTGLYTASVNSGKFTVTAGNSSQPAGTVTSAYDADGNVISRSWSLPGSGGQGGVTQTLTWDAFDRLIQVSQRDSSQNGYDWTAIYDGLGRRISTTLQPVANNVDTGAPTVTASIYDPQVEFLEIGVNVNGVQAYKVYGPDLNGVYGGLQGTGGLEATIMNGTGVATGVINDYFGNGVATVSGGNVTWNTTKVGGYGPLPDSAATPLTDATQLAQAIVWRGHYIDPTGFYNLGARYYEPVSGRFLSPDPMGHASSPSLYDFCNGDPVNNFDPDGRCLDYLNSPTFYYDRGVGPGSGVNISNDAPGTFGNPDNGWVNGGYEPDERSTSSTTQIIPTWAVNTDTGAVQHFYDPDHGSQLGSGAGFALLAAPELPFVGEALNWAKGLLGFGEKAAGDAIAPIADAVPLPKFTGFSQPEEEMLKNSLKTLQDVGHDTTQFTELLRADLGKETSGMTWGDAAAIGDRAFSSQEELSKTLEEELIHLQQKAAGQATVFSPGTAQSLEEAANAQKKL